MNRAEDRAAPSAPSTPQSSAATSPPETGACLIDDAIRNP